MIPDKILNVFNRSIKMVCSNIACYCNDPVSDFTRKRKLPAETLIHFIVQMQSKSLNSELCEYFTDLDSLPTASALCQQRDKLDISAFQRIMHLFVNAFDDYKTWKGYHVLACDGSDVNMMKRMKILKDRTAIINHSVSFISTDYMTVLIMFSGIQVLIQLLRLENVLL